MTEVMKQFWEEEDGLGTVEIVMIIAALMCIALLFRKQVFTFAKDIMEKVFDVNTVKKPSETNT